MPRQSCLQSQAPLALAQCCELMGRAYEESDDGETKQWYAEAKGWYEKAKAAHPDDFSIVRRLTDFFLQTKQMAEAEAQLDAILKRGANSQSAETVAWARRTLALTLASSTDPQRVRRCTVHIGAGRSSRRGWPRQRTALEDPEDLRVLARVLDAQKTVEHRKRAIEILESLIGKNLANADDRFLLARLYEVSGDWPKAREAYRELNLRTKNARDLETLNRRPLYLAQFVSSLLRNHKAGDDQDLIEAQDLVDELKQLQPDQLSTLVLQVEVDRARNQLDKAVDLIQTSAKRSDLAPIAIRSLAELAEKLGRFDIAEQLYRRYAALPNTRDGKIVLAMFLGRHGHIKEALDLCEPLWANPRRCRDSRCRLHRGDRLPRMTHPIQCRSTGSQAGWSKRSNKKTTPRSCWLVWVTAVNGRSATMRQRHFTRVSSSRALATRQRHPAQII